MRKIIIKIGIILLMFLIACEPKPLTKKKVIHEVIDDGKYFYDSNYNYMKYVFYKDGKYYKISGSWDAQNRRITPNFICTCKPYYRRGEYLNCVADGIVLEYSGYWNAIYTMKSDSSECISFHDMYQPMGKIIMRDPFNRVEFTGQFRNQRRNGRFIYYDTLGQVTKMELYEYGKILKTIDFSKKIKT